MQIKRLQLGPMQNFVYLLVPPSPRRLAVVDPAWEPGVLLREADALGRPLTDIVLTHHHADHRNAIEALLERGVQARIHVQQAELPWLGGLGWASDVVVHAPGDELDLGGEVVTLVHTPGHTPGSQCVRCGDQLLTGDTLFIDGCGRCDLPGGDPATMFDSLTRLMTDLPGHTRVLPGHDYAPMPEATLDAQRQSNPYLRLNTAADFVAFRMRPRR
jgi:glyoxylase-like metal-dependent hydrolase (beta-lactamase superfamily II)